MKKGIRAMLLSAVFLLSVSTNAFAAEITPFADPVENITSEFSGKMRSNAAYIAYYAYTEKKYFGTYPLMTGEEFVAKVKSGAPWDYKLPYGYSKKWLFGGITTTGEDLGNIHYGYVGRAAGFSELVLKSAAGAYQIYSGTYHVGWYNSYFDDPTDQAAIQRGFNYWSNGNLPSSFTLTLQRQELIDTLTQEQKDEIEQSIKDKAEDLGLVSIEAEE
ncbi:MULTISPECIES: polymorphic toxin type 44 domain-containing protein [unclassified Paenibacillus]|uniref:polymorphic toxin type 44 domain-containing protein n=1 Tax=unclassified Paenibacillus TaxID=185978 RepID=UPI002404AC94|nr:MULTISPECIES: polymorphic toxin type 44 domain-containing protein [unclassified Paenibacillus]MDF9844557.1 hypothetical protein [Paenibacillus sp. PastF-2]MDF9851158.1 hypothetical protein [Paenibacillus sp. PastM-2]MDF9856207.1 hypothetical protein [Paenibacillus sp. PastF-1]MDH6481564.1 hypothetical protein [Paenibacillus sp. PastH-2]MDH6510423.1 hypothetical protein [Paenibacillus sp. PastM-3]